MSAKHIPVNEAYRQNGLIDDQRYAQMYQHSIEDNEGFWAEQAQRLNWSKPFKEVKDVSFTKDDVHIRWFADGQLNACENCLDRHLESRGDQLALIWEADKEHALNRTFTYRELHRQVCKMANGLKALGVKKGDVVTIYLPMVPLISISMLACARIGAVHSVVFGGFSPEAIAGRISDGDSRVIITADEGLRAGKTVRLKHNVDKAVEHCPVDQIDHVLVLHHTGGDINWNEETDIDVDDLLASQSDDCPAETMGAEDPLFILYTSGSTGKPKGVLHTTGGYLCYASLTHEAVFDYQSTNNPTVEPDTYWCMADIGWITGHTYAVYGPLCNGAKVVMYEGVPNYPNSGRMARLIEKHQVAIVYTAPTAIRALMADGDAATNGVDLSCIKLLATAGEPINPEAWRWFHEKFGSNSAPILDTWWQTETGGMLITPLPGATDLKPGSATRPFFGIQAALMDADGNEIPGAGEGSLVIKDSWPGQMRTIYGDHQRFVETYFSTFDNCYFTSDGAKRDDDGYYWITGRMDDVLNVAGHRMGTAEIESALVAHKTVAEAAVVGIPHDIKGQAIYVYVTLTRGVNASEELRQELRSWVREEIGPIASPEFIQWAPSLPKTRSGKIMRRILRKIACSEYDQLGDISTLAEPAVVEGLILEHQSSYGK